jgi:hypothetical protein
MIILPEARNALNKLVARLVRMPFPLLAALLQLLLIGGELAIALLVSAAGVAMPASNIERQLQFSPAFTYWSALLFAPIIESLIIIAACKIASKILPRVLAVLAVATAFALLHDMSGLPGYLVLFWVGFLFCAANELAIERHFSLRVRFWWLAVAHAIYNGCTMAIYFQVSAR